MKFNKPFKHYLGLSLFIVLCLLTVVVVIMPIAVQYYTQSWLREQGLDAEINYVGFNINSGTFLVENAQGKNAESKGFSLNRLLVEVNWRPLFDKRLDIQRIEVDGLSVDIESRANGLVIAGLDLNKLSQPQAAEQAEKQGSESTEPVDWSAQLHQVTLSNIKACHYNDAGQLEALTINKMMHACVALDSMKWRGAIGWAAPASGQPVTDGIAVQGNLLFEKFILSNHDASQTYVAWDNINIEQLGITGLQKVKSALIEIKQVALLQHNNAAKAPYLASWESLKILSTNIHLDKQRASIDTISLHGLKADIDRSKSGIAGLPITTEAEKEEQVKDTASKQAFSFAIKNININGNSAAAIKDKTVDPVFSESINAINISIRNVDSSQPKQKSPLLANMKVSEYGQVNIEGSIQPFTERLTINLKQDIKHVDLANYNVYGKTFIGHRIHSGHLNLEQKLAINHGKLDTESVLILNKFKVESLEGKEAEKYKSDLGIPLSAALALLRDRHDNIRLSIPVTGDLHHPDFSLNDVISTVTSKVIKEAIINYYTPFGLVKILGGIVDLAAGLSFEPVVFTAGKAELEQAGIDNMTKLSQLLADRPHVQLTFCGHPSRKDILAKYKLKELGLKKGEEQKTFKLNDKQASELLALFSARMDNMKKYMVNQLKVSPGQLLLCSEPDNKQWLTGIESKPEIAITI